MLSEVFQPELPGWLRQLYPFSTRTFSVDGQRMSLVDAGAESAPALVMVHGNPTWSLLWRALIARASERFRVIAPDNVGFGLSSKPQAGYHSLDRHIDNLDALIGQLGLKQVTLLLHDWGGLIGLGYAVRRPENVSRVVLLNTPPPAPQAPRALPWQMRTLQSSIGSSLGVLMAPAIQRAAATRLSGDLLRGYGFPFQTSQDRAAIREFAKMVPEDQSRPTARAIAGIVEKLHTIDTRVDIVWGKQDPVFGGVVLPYLWRDAFPASTEPVILSTASHLVPEDEPAAILEKLLEVFRPKQQKPQALFKIIQ